ncbi:hypothetical protein CK203_047281 [Vitis vinifera]|uniref:Uncharacterized protein n=1 Tax=Vitis vinifera TaxID=29760 RepID=A0A438HZ25_VITVI|nr:hypothetical protein CK203_047281 [Vitis vinifera]
MEVVNACPHHIFDTWMLVSYFYEGMSPTMKQLLETMCRGDFMSKSPDKVLDFLNHVMEISRSWDEPHGKDSSKAKPQNNSKRGMYTLNEDVDMQAKMVFYQGDWKNLKQEELMKSNWLMMFQFKLFNALYANPVNI